MRPGGRAPGKARFLVRADPVLLQGTAMATDPGFIEYIREQADLP